MSKIGLITLFSRNYGSALQCYATKKYIENLGFKCVVMYQSFNGIEKYKTYLKKGMELIATSIRYPDYYKKFMEIRKAGKYSINSLSKESEKKLDLFVDSVIQPYPCTYKLLAEFAADDDYSAFITGSDQVWSANRPYDPVMFLRFAPPNKRIAFSASFGCDFVPDYNRKRFKKAINEIPNVSVREDSGCKIVCDLTGKKPLQLSDPTVLLSADEWRLFSKDGYKSIKDYVFAHFLDTPRPEAIELVNRISEEQELCVILFAYPHEEYSEIKNKMFVDGDPRDYLSLIDGAKYIVTDSFHTAQFSIYFEKSFYVFERQYRHSASQTSRIDSLLSLYKIEDRFIRSDEINYNNKLNIDLGTIQNEREKCSDFLISQLHCSTSLNKNKKAADDMPVLKKEDCTGCGVCSLVCNRKAVVFEINVFGYSVPKIDHDKCIQCGMCENVCKDKSYYHKNNAEIGYIAFQKNRAWESKSASGGIFSAFALETIRKGGIVFGACLSFDSVHAVIQHCGIENEKDLPLILNSKYVQSDCSEAYIRIKRELESGRNVLFGGTSCQVEGLYRYLGKMFSNLLTVDLICHGVPGQAFFDDYIQSLNRKYHGTIKDFSFRSKNNGIEYIETILFEDGRTVCIPWNKSPYFRMFLAEESYRDSCYSCRYSSTAKPADITVGDYFEASKDYPNLFREPISIQKRAGGISCILINTEKGSQRLEDIKEKLELYQADVIKIQMSHAQLRHPPHYSIYRKKLFDIYSKGGHEAIRKYFLARDITLFIPKRSISFLRRIIKK